ncbi:hypothetical protein QQ045_013910 [Rhodiola kirilowii]
MDSSDEDDYFPSFESITPLAKIDSVYQSNAEKGIRKICCELLDLKDAVEALCSNMRTKYLAFLRLSEETREMKHELVELQKHVSSQRILVQDLMSGVCHDLEEWHVADAVIDDDGKADIVVYDTPSIKDRDRNMTFLENIDAFLAEHEVDKAIEALENEERNSSDLRSIGDASAIDPSSFKLAFFKRKQILEAQLVEIATHPSAGVFDVRNALCGLLKLGKGALAHQLLIESYGSRLQRNIDVLLTSSSIYADTYSAMLSRHVFSSISLLIKESRSLFGEDPIYTNRVVQWAEWKLEYFLRLVKENAPSPDTITALRAAGICVQVSITHCSLLESQGLKLCKLLLVLIRPYIEEVLELNFRRARRILLGLDEIDESSTVLPSLVLSLSAFTSFADSTLVDSGMRFMSIINGILEQLTPFAISHFVASILTRVSQLFDKYVDDLIKSLPGLSEDENLAELNGVVLFRAETDAEQLALLGLAYTIADELLPEVLAKNKRYKVETDDQSIGASETFSPFVSATIEHKEFKRQIQHSLDKLKDHFCRQYVLAFIYSRDGRTRLDAQIYLTGAGDDLNGDSEPMPSLPFQALFAKLKQLATVAGDVLLGKEKLQKILLARLTETVVMWLSDDQEFWGVIEDDSIALQPLGLQQLFLDMHFTVEIARFAGYPSRTVHQLVSAIIARAIASFSARGIDPQSALPEDEWFVQTAKKSINKLLIIPSESESSDIDEDHIFIHNEILSESDDSSLSSLSTLSVTESFYSAGNGDMDTPLFSDAES